MRSHIHGGDDVCEEEAADCIPEFRIPEAAHGIREISKSQEPESFLSGRAQETPDRINGSNKAAIVSKSIEREFGQDTDSSIARDREAKEAKRVSVIAKFSNQNKG